MSTTTLDTGVLPAGANEELAGPPHAVAPVDREERISSIDMLRGFSLMGILVMNICDFAYGYSNYTFPINTVKPVFNGPHWKVNTIAWFLRWILAEGKMRALFSMLFGAGVILLTERGEKRGAGLKVADIYTRRNMWLVLFGMLHGFLIWGGDILFYYGTCALLFLFPFRNLRAKRLMWIAGIVLALNSALLSGGQFGSAISAKKAADKVNAKLAKHQPLEEKDQDALKKWKSVQERWRVPTKKMYEDIAANQKGYWAAQGHAASDVLRGELKGAYFGFGDWFGMMLLGMALYRNGFLSGRLSRKTYAWCAVIGLGISWSVVGVGTYVAWKGGFDFFQTNEWTLFPYDVGRVSGALGNAAFLMVLLKSGVFKWALQRIAAVGQMALSNYLLTSISMQFLFTWGPLHWYGYMEYYKIYYVVFCMWTVNLVFSSIWLRYFRFGPAEWVWRSLTYWKKQPMRLLPRKTAALA
ncbi:DUF418 domain-containing protein [Terriglobus saanensis]|uniref:DUF418 domain-containing protein n=1 Tax=Terriglobus saanensis (strain ATCC BAA-1853 / DSM 23119 / SP1PR4) TaxID=401053 RepID=E8V4X8_TERSS|nr:DUF418 domain-containing protein [Terriglobus saanensis]ADV82606.1 protein of unknown function DUF418 [Terriglobus saanensis SP1PR4]